MKSTWSIPSSFSGKDPFINATGPFRFLSGTALEEWRAVPLRSTLKPQLSLEVIAVAHASVH